jgi:hypothetical protein
VITAVLRIRYPDRAARVQQDLALVACAAAQGAIGAPCRPPDTVKPSTVDDDLWTWGHLLGYRAGAARAPGAVEVDGQRQGSPVSDAAAHGARRACPGRAALGPRLGCGGLVSH